MAWWTAEWALTVWLVRQLTHVKCRWYYTYFYKLEAEAETRNSERGRAWVWTWVFLFPEFLYITLETTKITRHHTSGAYKIKKRDSWNLQVIYNLTLAINFDMYHHQTLQYKHCWLVTASGWFSCPFPSVGLSPARPAEKSSRKLRGKGKQEPCKAET